MNPRRIRILAAAVAGQGDAPHDLLVEFDDARCRILPLGEARPSDQKRGMPDRVLLPALVNAHTHLDLSLVGPRPYRRRFGFPGWLSGVRAARMRSGHDPIEAARAGCALLRRGGVAGVGDIAGDQRSDLTGVLRGAGLEGVSFLEAFGTGPRQADAVRRIGKAVADAARTNDHGPVRAGVQPHAPYSAGPEVYAAAADGSEAGAVPVSTHLAESLAERRWIESGTGAMRPFLRRLGADAPGGFVACGRSAVAALAGVLERAPWLVAHVNDASDDDIEILARTRTHVAYCPRASAYFGHPSVLGPHRYRDMLAAGVNVALGTDSIISLPRHEADRLSTLDEMRHLWRRDRTDPRTLLDMATVNGARALGLDPGRFTLAPGAVAGVIAVDVSGTPEHLSPLERVLESAAMPEWIWPEAPS